jgi:hypothetical protein
MASTEFVSSAGLSGGTYHWRVRGVNSSELGDWSDGWTFAVRTPSPTKFDVYLPVVVWKYP